MTDRLAVSEAENIALEPLIDGFDSSMDVEARPKYGRIVDAFTDSILAGRFRPGQRVPAETSLANLLCVSVGTVRKALDQLVLLGLVVRYRKNGTFISGRSTQVNEVFVYRCKDPATGKTLLPFVRTIAVETEMVQGPWSRFLQSDQLVRVDRLVWFDQQPPALANVFFQFSHGRALLDVPLEQLNGASVHRIILDRFNLPTLRMEHSLQCQTLPDTVCRRLNLPERALGSVWDIKEYTLREEPLLYQRYHLQPGHQPIEITETVAGPNPRVSENHHRDKKESVI